MAAEPTASIAPPAPEPQQRLALGVGITVVAATIFGFVTPLTRFSYDFGVNPSTAALFPVALGAVAAAVIVMVLRRGLTLPRAAVPWTLGVTVSVSATTLCYVSAVAFIPVSLAVLLFYTYPLMVAAYTSLVHGSRLGAKRWSAFALAFVGLAIAFGSSFDDLDWLGVSLAVAAAAALAGLFIFSAAALRYVSITTITFYSNAGSVPVMIAGLYFLGGLALPAADMGWFALIGASGCYAAGIFLHFAAILLAGPTRAAMLFNLEPVVAMAVAALLLGESLSVVQYGGGALVIAALVLSTMAERPGRSSA